MKRFLTWFFIFFFLILWNQGKAQSNGEYTRKLKFVDLRDSANAPFWRLKNQLTKHVFKGIESGTLTPLWFSYKRDTAPIPIDTGVWRKIVSTENYMRSHRDFPVLILDALYSDKKGKDSVRIQYVGFCLKGELTSSGNPEYFFSIRWDSLIHYLNEKRIIYYTMSRGIWWRGSVFMTHNKYIRDLKGWQQFIRLSNKNSLFKVHNYRTGKEIPDIKRFDSHSDSSSEWTLFIEENKVGNTFQVQKVGLEQGIFTYRKRKQISFDWNQYQNIARNKRWQKSSSVLFMGEALRLKEFSYKREWGVRTISKASKLTPAPAMEPTTKEISSVLKLYVTETLHLENAKNASLYKNGKGVVNTIINAVYAGKITPLNRVSLCRSADTLTKQEFDHNLRGIYNFSSYHPRRNYSKGDTIEKNNAYYRAKGEINYVEKTEFRKKDWKRFYPDHISRKNLDIMDLAYKQTFNQKGNNIQYKLKQLTLYIPIDIKKNTINIQVSICTVRWQELKPILQEKHPEMVKMLENLKAFTYFLKTSLLKEN